MLKTCFFYPQYKHKHPLALQNQLVRVNFQPHLSIRQVNFSKCWILNLNKFIISKYRVWKERENTKKKNEEKGEKPNVIWRISRTVGMKIIAKKSYQSDTQLSAANKGTGT